MALEVKEQAHSGLLRLIEETLTDGSHVYNLTVGNTILNCADKTAAYTLFGLIDNPAIIVDIEVP